MCYTDRAMRLDSVSKDLFIDWIPGSFLTAAGNAAELAKELMGSKSWKNVTCKLHG